MRWLIDGYNVIRRDADLRAAEAESLEAGRTALLHLVARLARETGDQFTVVFDGVPGHGPSGSAAARGLVEVVFSRAPQTADDVLIRLAARWREGGAVVTADRTIQQAARRANCAIVTPDQFLGAIGAPAADGEPDDDDEVDDARSRRGNPRRLSKDARATARALRRLR